MAAPGIAIPIWSLVNASGVPVSSGKVYSWVPTSAGAATATPRTLYSNPGCTTEAANPFILGTSGHGDLYRLPSESVVIVLKSADDATTYHTVYYGVDVDDAAESFNVTFYGATGDGTTDDSDAIQDAIDACETAGGGTVYFPPGTYICKGLTVPSNVTLRGEGRSVSILKAPAGLGITEKILSNETTATFTNSNIILDGLGFDGNNAGSGSPQTRFTGLVEFGRVTYLSITNCSFYNVQYIGLACGGCLFLHVDKNLFTDCGWQGTSANGGPALFINEATADSSQFVTVTNNIFRENFWTPTSVNGVRVVIDNNLFDDNQECGIFTPLTGSAVNRDVTISNNAIFNVQERDISGSGMEIGGFNVTIIGNTVANTDHNGILVTDLQNSSITGNAVRNFNLDSLASTPQAVGIGVSTTSSAPDQPQNIIISGNTIEDDQGSPTGQAALGIGGSGDAAVDVVFSNNSIAPIAWVGSVYATTKAGVGCSFHSNSNATDFFVTPTIAGAATIDLASTDMEYVEVSGTSYTCTSLGTANAATKRKVRFTGTGGIITHNGTSLILPGSANITTVAGDTAEFISLGSGNWLCLRYSPINQRPFASGTWTPSLGGDATYTSRTGVWVRIGNLVYVFCSITVNVLGTGSTSTVSGLPFVPAVAGVTLPVSTSTGLAVTPVSFAMYVNLSSAAVATGRTAANASVTDSLAIFGNGARVDFSGFYHI